jgi:NADH:ubiquinone oxidoreductase subunit 6 (subunit J)
MKIFLKKILYLNIGLLAYALANPLLTMLIGENILPASDIYIIFGAAVVLLLSAIIVLREKASVLKDKLLKILIAMCCFVLSLGLSIYLMIVVWLSLGLSY